MSQVDYLPFGTGAGANVDSQVTFAGSAYQQNGFVNGYAYPNQANKVWRQASMVASAVATWISNTLAVNVLDDGNLGGLVTLFGNAVSAAVSTGLTAITAELATLTAQVTALTSTVTRNSNGVCKASPDGTVQQWGLSVASGTGGPRETVAITFPVPFASIPVVVCSPNQHADGSGNNPFSCYPTNITTNGFTANLAAGVLIGGSGAANINNPVQVGWRASI